MSRVFDMIAAEYREESQSLPAETTEIVNPWRAIRSACRVAIRISKSVTNSPRSRILLECSSTLTAHPVF
jgi:hypothetical protein